MVCLFAGCFDCWLWLVWFGGIDGVVLLLFGLMFMVDLLLIVWVYCYGGDDVCVYRF